MSTEVDIFGKLYFCLKTVYPDIGQEVDMVLFTGSLTELTKEGVACVQEQDQAGLLCPPSPPRALYHH